MKIIIIVIMVLYSHSRITVLLHLHVAWVEDWVALYVYHWILHGGALRWPRVLRNLLVLMGHRATCVIDSWRKHYRLLEVRLGLLLLLRHSALVVSVLTTAASLPPIPAVGHWHSWGVLRLLLLILVLFYFLFVVFFYLSIESWHPVRHFQIGGPHVSSPAIDMTDLHLCDEHVRDPFIVVANEAKSPTGLGNGVANDLVFFDLSKLLEVIFKSLISKIVVESSNEDLVPNARICLIL